MSQFPHIHLPLKHKLTFTANPVNVVPLPGGEIVMNFASQPLITKLSAGLEIIWEKIAPGAHPNYVSSKLAASADGRMIAIAGMTDIRFIDAEGATILHTIPHDSWSWLLGAACFFSRDHQTIWYVLPGKKEEKDVLQIADAATFEVIASLPLLNSFQYTYTFHATPDNGAVLLEAAAGQDDTVLMQLQLANRAITLTELTQCDDVIIGNFAPSGKEFSVAPHYNGPLEIYAYPAIAKVAQQEQADIFEGSKDYPATEPDNINYSVFFVNDDHLLVVSRFGRLLLLDRQTLRCKAEVMPEGIEFTAYQEDGDETSDPEQTYEYSSNIIDVMIVHDQLLLTTSDGQLRGYDLPA